MTHMIKLGLRYASTSRQHLQLVRQLGVEGGTLRWIRFPGAEASGGHVDREGFRALLDRFAEFDLALGGMELSRPLIQGVLHGDAERAAGELEALCETVRLLGDHGIDLLTCGFAIAHADEGQHDWRGYRDEPLGRAGAVLRTFDAARLDAADLVTWGGRRRRRTTRRRSRRSLAPPRPLHGRRPARGPRRRRAAGLPSQ